MTTALPNIWHHSSLAVNNLSLGKDFYCGAFGYKVQFEEYSMDSQIEQITGVTGLICDLAQLHAPYSNHVLELIHFHRVDDLYPREIPAPIYPGMAHVAFFVDDLVSYMKKVESHGAKRLGRVTKFEDGNSVYYQEPAGSFFEMEENHPNL